MICYSVNIFFFSEQRTIINLWF